jgi:hypothetical protein
MIWLSKIEYNCGEGQDPLSYIGGFAPDLRLSLAKEKSFPKGTGILKLETLRLCCCVAHRILASAPRRK